MNRDLMCSRMNERLSEPLRTLKALMTLSKDEKSGKGCILRVFLSVFSELSVLSGSGWFSNGSDNLSNTP